jgi:hypothetical protein
VAAAEWQVLERCRIVLEEAIGIETVRITPDIAIEMYCGYRDSDDVAGRELNTPIDHGSMSLRNTIGTPGGAGFENSLTM